jgi:hypothetical protein
MMIVANKIFLMVRILISSIMLHKLAAIGTETCRNRYWTKRNKCK